MRATMLTYARRGRARVFALTIAAPRDPKRAVVTSTVNAALVRAAEGLAAVSVLRMDVLFSPQGLRGTMPYEGKEVDVREPAGTHLKVAGTRIAARVVAMRWARSAGDRLSRRSSCRTWCRSPPSSTSHRSSRRRRRGRCP